MTERSESERAELVAERDELMAKNAAATSWGAAVGARHERIMEIDRTLADEKRIRSALSEPAVAANASAEARLREALVWALSEIDLGHARSRSAFPADAEKKKRFDEVKALALSAHPHASDCDKQGWLAKDVEAAMKRIAEWEASDRTADVTVEDLADFLNDNGCLVSGDDEEEGLARALLDAFTMGRR